MQNYLDLLNTLLSKGIKREDRTGTGTLGLFGYQMRFDLQAGFPLLTTKKVHFRSVKHELLWFMRGSTDVRSLQEVGVSIWDEWATEEQTARFGRVAGDLGPIYGHQWRNFGGACRDPQDPSKGYGEGVDQLTNLIEGIRRNPWSRRHIVTAWNPTDVGLVALPPCHTLFQFHVEPDEEGKPYRLSCHLYQRSADVFLGVPFNIASYALLTMLIAEMTNLEPGDFIHSFGDVHLYLNHIEQAKLQIIREPRALPRVELQLESPVTIESIRADDIALVDYDPYPAIKAEVSV